MTYVDTSLKRVNLTSWLAADLTIINRPVLTSTIHTMLLSFRLSTDRFLASCNL